MTVTAIEAPARVIGVDSATIIDVAATIYAVEDLVSLSNGRQDNPLTDALQNAARRIHSSSMRSQ